MDNSEVCAVCHVQVRATDYFCFNCGKNLKPKPLSTSITSQIVIYVESLVLPPYGLILGLRYLRQKDTASKLVGMIAIVLTVIVLVVCTKVTIDLINTVNTQITAQMGSFGY
jgi:hypothetical protein